MAETARIEEAAIDQRLAELDKAARQSGYTINPDPEFSRELTRSLLINQKRYGYEACPCRLASGVAAADLDIVCPCDYRDPDLEDYGACYCGLYVSAAVASGSRALKPIPERRPARKELTLALSSQMARESNPDATPQGPGLLLQPSAGFAYPVWRCKVCGYLCANEKPPLVCPICKAQQERFERFM
jgi:ferredoxin-thioredoxin reductase catalytic chain